jgi:hypothetical protein
LVISLYVGIDSCGHAGLHQSSGPDGVVGAKEVAELVGHDTLEIEAPGKGTGGTTRVISGGGVSRIVVDEDVGIHKETRIEVENGEGET